MLVSLASEWNVIILWQLYSLRRREAKIEDIRKKKRGSERWVPLSHCWIFSCPCFYHEGFFVCFEMILYLYLFLFLCGTVISTHLSLVLLHGCASAWVRALEWGMGARGEGSKPWPPFSVTREPCSSLSHRSGIQRHWLSVVSFLSIRYHLQQRGEMAVMCFLEPGSLCGISQNLLRIYLPKLWWIIAPDLRMPCGSAYFFDSCSSCLPGSCGCSVLSLALSVCTI